MEKEETAMDVINRLKEKYKGDDEVMEVVEDAAKDIEYIEKRVREGNYDGQSALGLALEAEGTLDYWY